MPNSLTWCDLPEDVSLWPGLPLSLSGDEVMPLDYHAGRSGWLLYGRGLDKRRLTAWQRELGAALVIVASWVCLLYTSEAADDLLCVDLGGRRIVKKNRESLQS